MQKKTDKLLEKIVKKDYNNKLEEILEKKYFSEEAKSMLLSMLYKVEAAYKDYEKIKPNSEEKAVFIQSIIDSIKNNCEDIKIVKVNSEESAMLKNKTFLVEKKKKRIICYPIERKLLYCISKIDKKETIIKESYSVIDKTLSDLINVGNCIDTVESIRDFNGFSWTTIPQEIESIYHNIVYQNIRILVGNKFLNDWTNNNEFIIDYFDVFKNKLEKLYGEEFAKEFLELLCEISVLLAIKYNSQIKKWIKKDKLEVEEKLEKIKDNKKFVQEITKEKIQITKEIKTIDETANDKKVLQAEYERRNEDLPLKKKIFSIKILSKMLSQEREEKLKRLEELNRLLNPQKFVEYKKELEEKEKYLKLLDIKELESQIKQEITELQKIFSRCFIEKLKYAKEKEELMDLICEFRYYCLIPFNKEKSVSNIKTIEKEIKEVEEKLIEKAHELKVIDVISEDSKIDYEVLKNIFYVRVINLEELYIKFIKEKDKCYVQIFDEESFEEKIEIKSNETDKDLKKIMKIKPNKKIKIFN